ncbi:MAG: hypothetical protein J5703_06420, partial [Methanomicrobium sp.]|nr:hypothetical protein [Methanomicrobium sp.]
WGADDKTRELTWYAQADYSWSDRYYLQAGFSAEASSRFGDDAEGLKLDAEERARKAKVKKSKSATVRKAIQRAIKTKTEKN